ncbi:MAG: 5-formyltetrahydrofolate cyclo-ligase [Bacteroidales bacterium]
MSEIIEIKDKKKAIRKHIAEIKKTISMQLKQDLSEIIMAKVEKLPEFKMAKTILLYYSLPDEVQTELFLKKWAKTKTGKRIVLPVVEGVNLILKEYKEDMIAKGYQSILEPTNTCTVNPNEIELAIIPGVAFDSSCNRLGRGKGFYDRLLPNVHCKIIGLGYDFQMVDQIPLEEFDQPLNKVITNSNCFIAQEQHPRL